MEKRGLPRLGELEPGCRSRQPGDVGMLLFSKLKWSHLPTGCSLLECGADSEEGWWWGESRREGKGLGQGIDQDPEWWLVPSIQGQATGKCSPHIPVFREQIHIFKTNVMAEVTEHHRVAMKVKWTGACKALTVSCWWSVVNRCQWLSLTMVEDCCWDSICL